MALQNFGGSKTLSAHSFQLKNGVRIFDGSGFPSSGTTGSGIAVNGGPDLGSVYIDSDTGTQFVNEGTRTSPYWTPLSMDQRDLVGVITDFSKNTGRAGSATTAFSYDNGVRYFGQGVEVNDADTAVTISYPLDGPLATVGTTNEASHVTALGYGGTAGLWRPDRNGVMVIEATFTGITDIVTRAFFLGFSGDADGAMANEIDPVVTGSTTTLTFSAVGTAGDNCHGLLMDSRLTAASTLFLATNAANAAATQTTASAALTVAGSVPAAATYVRLRVEIDAAGALRAFVNKVEVKKVASGAATITKVLCPIFSQENTTTTASLQMGVRRFGTWAKRYVS
jgi:hypothetical protein